MKVGIIVDNELNSDIRVLREIRILKDLGYDIYILCFGFGKNNKLPIPDIFVKRFNISRKLRDVLFFLLNTIPIYEWIWACQIKKFLTINNIDILHVHDLYMSRTAKKGIIKSLSNIPMILDLHENYPFTVTTYNWTKGFFRSRISKPQKWQKKEKEYLLYADRIITLSSDYSDLLRNRYPVLEEKTFTVLPNVPDLSQLSQQYKKPVRNSFSQDFPVMFYYGVVAERRGIFDALEVFTELITENFDINFLIIGPADKKDKTRFINLINQNLIANHIHYVPWIDSSDLSSYLSISDFCIAPFHKNPQHESGVANKIYEYMLGAKPLIVSDCLPQQNLVEKHKCGLVFTNLTEFKDAIVKYINDTDMRLRFGMNGYNAIMKEHNMEIAKGSLIKLYESLLCHTLNNEIYPGKGPDN